MPNISFFKNVRGVIPTGQLSVDAFIEQIRSGRWESSVSALRNMADKDVRKQVKEGLPCVTVSGVFTKRDQTLLVEHSGFICIDFDTFPETTDLDTARSLIYADPFTYSGFLSCSGNGFAILIRIEPDASMQKKYYDSISEYYKQKYGLETDPAPKNVASLRFVSFDPDLYLNEDSNIYLLDKNVNPEKPVGIGALVEGAINSGYQKKNEASPGGADIDFVMQEVRARGAYLAETYLDWVKLGYAFASEYGESGWKYFNEISSFYPKYNERDTRKKYEYCLRGKKNGCTIATFYGMCKDAGIPLFPPHERKTTTIAKQKKKDHQPADPAPSTNEPPEAPPETTNEPPAPPPEAPPPLEPNNPYPSWDNEYFKILGFVKSENNRQYVFFDKTARQIIVRSATALGKRENLTEIAPPVYWGNYFKKDSGFSERGVTTWLIRSGTEKGVFSMSLLRGRGLWFEDNKIIVHNGDGLIVDHHPIKLDAYQSEYVYEAGASLGFSVDNPMPVDEAKKYLEMFENINFARKDDLRLLLGWAVIAPFCGILPWRPHIWLIGESGAGKTHILREYILPMLGKTAIAVFGNSSEAGIRQRLRFETLVPVIDEKFDETEHDRVKFKQILNLARSASSEGDWESLKGTVSHNSTGFKMQSCFAFGSVGDSLREQQDKYRFSVIEIKGGNSAERFEKLEQLKEVLMTGKNVASLQSRTLNSLPTLLENMETFRKAVSTKTKSPRTGQQIGVLLAGAYSLEYDGKVSLEGANEYIADFDFVPEMTTAGDNDEKSLISWILGEQVTVDDGRSRRKYTIGELIKIACNYGDSDDVKQSEANKELQRNGIRCDTDFVYIASSHKSLIRILKNTTYENNYNKFLQRIPGAKHKNGNEYFRRYFANVRFRAVAVPYPALEMDFDCANLPFDGGTKSNSTENQIDIIPF